MIINIAYSKKEDVITMEIDDGSLCEDLCDELSEELEEFKVTLCADIEVDMTIDEKSRTAVSVSKRTGNTFRCRYDALDADEICYCLHEVAVMDDVNIYIE